MTTTYYPGPTPNTVLAIDGKIITVPVGWILVPPGDPALTRRIKAAGEHYAVAERRALRFFHGASGHRRPPWSGFRPISKPSDLPRASSNAKKPTPGEERKSRPNMWRTFTVRSWGSWPFILFTPPSPTSWLVP